MGQSIGQKIRRFRQREGLTQADLASKVGVSPATIINWEMGKTKPSAEKIKKLDLVLGGLSSKSQKKAGKYLAEEVSSFGVWVRNLRELQGLSVPELSMKANVSPPAIYNIENGKIQNPQASTRKKIADALGSPIPDQIVSETAESQHVEGLGSLVDFQPHDNKDWPECSGVYVLYDVSQRPIYVGKAERISVRLKAHQDKFWFRSPLVEFASYIEVSNKELRHQLEQAMIKFLKSNAVINKQSIEDFGGD